MKPFLLFAEPRWVGFQLLQEGNQEAHEFDSISEAFAFAREFPECEGAPFLVFDDKGKEMARLTV
jgi:hypothetical protein